LPGQNHSTILYLYLLQYCFVAQTMCTRTYLLSIMDRYLLHKVWALHCYTLRVTIKNLKISFYVLIWFPIGHLYLCQCQI
jgi:hypothetical protein